MSEEQVAPVVGAAAGDAKSTDTAVHETGAEASEGSAVLIEAAAHPAAEVSAQSADAPDTPVKTSADELLAGANKFLKPIPGCLHFHVGKMVPSHRSVVDQTYQVALNLVFKDKQAQDDYQVHPMHLEFVEPTKRYADIIIPEGGFEVPSLLNKVFHLVQLMGQV